MDKVYVYCPGDMSVGIASQSVWLEMNLDYADDDYKEFIREQLKEAFDKIYDDNCEVFLSQDEYC